MLLNALEQFSFNVSATPSVLFTILFYFFIFSKTGLFDTFRGIKISSEFFVFSFVYKKIFRLFINSRFDRFGFIFIGCFSFTLLLNLIGTFTFAFSFTGISFLTSLMAFSLILWTLFIAVARFNINFFSLLAPIGTPGFLAKSLIVIETVSYLGRFASINIRLFINIISGHLVLKLLYSSLLIIFSSLSFSPLAFFSLFCLILLTLFIFILEIFVASLQAYIFFFLLCIYLKDCLW